MTSGWEEKLLQIECRSYSSEQFLVDINQMITTLIATYQKVKDAELNKQQDINIIGECPCCKSDVVEKYKGFFCSNEECKFALWKENSFFNALSKKMTSQIATDLLKHGEVKLKGCRSIKTGKTYDTKVIMKVDSECKIQFILDFSKGGNRNG